MRGRDEEAPGPRPRDRASPRSLILGLGNPLLTDDGVGPEVAARVHEALARPEIRLRRESAGGIEIMEMLAGYDRAVVIDAIVTGRGRPGELYRVDLESSRGAPRTGGSHTLGLLEGLELGRRLGWVMPDPVLVYAVEVSDPYTFGEELTPEVRDAVPEVAARIASEVGPTLTGSPERIDAASPGRTAPPR